MPSPSELARTQPAPVESLALARLRPRRVGNSVYLGRVALPVAIAKTLAEDAYDLHQYGSSGSSSGGPWWHLYRHHEAGRQFWELNFHRRGFVVRLSDADLLELAGMLGVLVKDEIAREANRD